MARPRKGKYAGIVDTLPRYPLVEPTRQDAVDAVIGKINLPPDQLEDAMTVEAIDGELKRVEVIMYEINNAIVRGTGGRKWASEYARLYTKARRVRERIAAIDSIFSVTIEAFAKLMVDQMEVEGTSSLKLDDGQPVSTYPEPYATVVDRDAFRDWCIEQGLLRQLQLPWQTTNSLVKKMLIEGQPEPPGISVSAKTVIRLSSAAE